MNTRNRFNHPLALGAVVVSIVALAARPDLKHLMVAGEMIEDATGKSSLYVSPVASDGILTRFSPNRVEETISTESRTVHAA